MRCKHQFYATGNEYIHVQYTETPLNPLALNLGMTIGISEELVGAIRTSQAHPSRVSYSEGEMDETLEAW